MLVGIPLTACGRASGGGPKRGTERDGAVPCVKIADGMDARTTRNTHVSSFVVALQCKKLFLLIYGHTWSAHRTIQQYPGRGIAQSWPR
jgi:hypothetical protein